MLPEYPIAAHKRLPVHLAGSVLQTSRHVCAFFHSKDEEYDVLLPFIGEGIEQGDKGYHIIESTRRPAHRRRLGEAGIDTAAAEAKGQLDIRAWEAGYLRDGDFHQERMLALIAQVLTAGTGLGCPITRVV